MSGPTRPPGGALGSPGGAPLSRKVVVEFCGLSSAVPATPSSAERVVGGALDAVRAPVVRADRRRCRPSRALDGLVTDERAAAVLVADLPVGGVGAERGDVDAGVARRLEAVELLERPVLGVAGDDDDLVRRSSCAGCCCDRDVVGVGDVVALLLEPGDEVDVGPEEPVLVGAPRRPAGG